MQQMLSIAAVHHIGWVKIGYQKNAMPKMIQGNDPKSVVCYVLNVDR